MAVSCPENGMRIDAIAESRVMVIGGTNLGPSHMWWNFVSTSRERIEQAKEDWREERFGLVPGDEEERIPLPG
jgi:redox-sensitive bicupin YhaK (pirin superfamily)